MNTAEEFTPYDTADYLTNLEDVTAYLEAVIEEGEDDPRLITQALGAVARSRNLSEIARTAGISREGLYKALSADGNPSFATVVKVAQALGLRVRFQPAA
ncbi:MULTISPECIES: addiction module antidote protein [unclassified Luteococcus]|uniref:addiction module antidote protein n=1 Tax=unclassified Luteococcus TaxID=2639923 RepID=UPI00313C0874